jgi:hypothetical protein
LRDDPTKLSQRMRRKRKMSMKMKMKKKKKRHSSRRVREAYAAAIT